MVPAKEFLHYLCGELDYKIFLGTECEGFIPLYKNMKPELMNYMPAVDEVAAVGMAIGNSIGGYKSCILLDAKNLYDLVTPIKNFAIEYKTPFLVVSHTSDIDKFPLKIPQAKLTVENSDNYKADLKRLVSKIYKDMVPGIFFVKEGVLT